MDIKKHIFAFDLKKILMYSVVFLCAIFAYIAQISQGTHASSSASFGLNSNISHEDSFSSTSFSLCSGFDYTSVDGDSTSYSLTPFLSCSLSELQIVSRRGECGNAILEPKEQCDDGNLINGDGCSDACQIEPPLLCGNSVIDPGEQCDDGNLSGGDGCSAACTLEIISPPPSGGLCGDSSLDFGEQCDDGNLTNGDGCSATCTFEVSQIICGDGVRNALFEQCDDGNTLNGDGCSSFCTIELPEPVCGDGFINHFSEQCDDGNLSNGDGCSSVCTLEEVSPVCGDGLVNHPSEACDDGNLANGDGCTQFCQIEVMPEIPEVPELPEVPEVPEGPEVPEVKPPIFVFPPDRFRPSAPFLAVCGNGVLEKGEQCDDGNLVDGDTCSSLCRRELPSIPGVGIGYLTNDETVLFYEQFSSSSGEYDVQLTDRDREYDVKVIPSSEEYFSLLLEDPLENGDYLIKVIDLLHPEQSLSLSLTVDTEVQIISPEIVRFETDVNHFDTLSDLRVYEEDFILVGKTPLTATIAVYSEALDETFILYTDDKDYFRFEYPIPLEIGDADRLQIVALYEDGTVSTEELIQFRRVEKNLVHTFIDCFLMFLALLIFTLLLLKLIYCNPCHCKCHASSDSSDSKSSKNLKENLSLLSSFLKKMLAILISVTVLSSMTYQTSAVTTTPTVLPYHGVLKTAGGVPITTAHDFRFSFWLDGDFSAGVDRDGAGAIPGAAPGYSGYSEVRTITPDSTGFFSVDIGEITAIPDFNTTTHLFIQVEIKVSGAADTTYETLDIDGVDNGTDRQAIGTIPYARNADLIDNAEVGTSSGDIVKLEAGDVFPVSTIPGGTNADTFEIDADDNAAGNISLSFGDTLNGQILEWNPTGVGPADGWFNFTDDVNITGNLTVTGTVNGVTVGTKSKSIQLQPEYEDAVLQGDGTSNKGKMEAFFVDTDGAAAPDNFNYYLWTTKQPALNDFDIVVRFRIPDDFTAFQASPIILRYRTSNGVLADNRVDVSIHDTTGTDIGTLTGNSALVSATWATTTVGFGGGGTFTVGDEITIFIKMSALSTGATYVSDMTINYVGSP